MMRGFVDAESDLGVGGTTHRRALLFEEVTKPAKSHGAPNGAEKAREKILNQKWKTEFSQAKLRVFCKKSTNTHHTYPTTQYQPS